MEEVKRCIQCGENKSLSDFYTVTPKNGKPNTRNRCKPCYVRYNSRFRVGYEGSAARKLAIAKYDKKRMLLAPEKKRARNKVNKEKQAGRLTPQPCMICGRAHRIHAHHDNYVRPLDVVWLCVDHHAERHKSLGW